VGLFHGTSIALTWGQHFARFTIVDFLTAAPATPSAAVPGPGPRLIRTRLQRYGRSARQSGLIRISASRLQNRCRSGKRCALVTPWRAGFGAAQGDEEGPGLPGEVRRGQAGQRLRRPAWRQRDASAAADWLGRGDRYPAADRFASSAIGGVYVKYARQDLNLQPSAAEASEYGRGRAT
jgi:hypothetical protein